MISIPNTISAAKSAVVLCLVGPIVGCSSLPWRDASSVLPVEIHPSNFGTMEVTAWESSNSLYVSGSVQKDFGMHHPIGATIRVALLDDRGVVLSAQEDRVPPARPGSVVAGRTRILFAVKFPLEEADQANRIRVSLLRSGNL